MNRSPLTKVLLGVATVLALWSLILCYSYINRARQFRALQMEVTRLTAKQQVLTMLVNEAAEYGKTHPAIDPILQSLKAPKPGPAATPAPATSAKPGTK